MKKIIILLLLFNFVYINVLAQAPVTFKFTRKTKPVKTVDWMYPLTLSDFNSYGNKQEVKFRIVYPNKTFKASNFTIFINGKVAGSKAGEVSINKIKRTFEHSIETELKLAPGKNQVKAMYNPPNSTDTLWSPTKTIFYEGGKTGLDNPPVEKPRETNYIYWLNPDITALNNNALVQKERELEVKVKIITDQPALTKDKIVVYHNNRILKTSSKSTLKRTGADEFVFKDYFQLTENPNPNFIYMDFKTEKRTYRTKATLKAQFSDKKPNLYVLAIGTDTNLKFTEDDAFDFAMAFKGQQGDGKLFSKANTNILVGKDAETANIRKTVEKLKVKYNNRVITDKDVVILFLSSHGFMHNGELRLQGTDYDPAARESTSLSYKNDILSQLDRLPCKKLIFLDACHSGAAGSKANIVDINFQVEKLNKVKEGTTIIASSQEDQQSYEDKTWQNGAFTEAIVSGLVEGNADLTGKGNNDGIVTIDELYEYLRKEVSEMVGNVKSEAQRPIMTVDGLKDAAIYIY